MRNEERGGGGRRADGGRSRLRIVIISSELTPYSKSGGLADVASKLSISLSQMGHRVMTVAPAYKWYEGAVGTDVRRTFTLYGGGHDVHYLHQWCPTDPREDGDPKMGVDRIFVQNANAFERAGMYGDPGGHDYFDNLFRFALFSWAALEGRGKREKRGGGGGGGKDEGRKEGGRGGEGRTRRRRMEKDEEEEEEEGNKASGLADNSYYDNYKWVFPPQERGDGGVVDDGECAKLLLGGINMADRVVTVSPSYKEEIMTDGGGWGLQHNVRARSDRLDGILNGIDTEEWDPETSKALPAQFSKSDLSGKAICKEKLQEALGLQKNPNAPIIAFIGRLAPQKGIDVLQECFHWLMGGDDQGVLGDAQLIMMGNGQAEYANFMRAAEGQYKGRICGYVGFSSEMEQRIIAGADILIMPSRYEPCGLPQMYAQRYGTIPVVHATGGLKDSVQQFEWREGGETVGTGWKFGNCDANGLKWGLWNALEIYKKKPEVWDNLRKRCMEQDFSWIASAKKYIQLMEWATMDPPKHEPWPFR
ncbi:hypothetical protein GUITHDRAFT_73067 [Guillardia theta CCMP2712]|uniref:starch synthase n=1 Tax=Guillardia theta (strain CCMP2712) TaxID=905079 RepID=L1J4E5_GUITC|nr:hypothetical protein GUITHDRAFT_73067 [Guillardia theta CCMP2712]EKX43398.1 hypothetical protein GUITHDRAFT_73067 [Guillardia theta CCMP2712]|eukprot:XP_005830378.1 hypothetical protein GUITHDRAFT_73067 [Guillardia theta CCMP2712]